MNASNDSNIFKTPIPTEHKWVWKLKHLFCNKKNIYYTKDGDMTLRGIYCEKHGEFYTEIVHRGTPTKVTYSVTPQGE